MNASAYSNIRKISIFSKDNNYLFIIRQVCVCVFVTMTAGQCFCLCYLTKQFFLLFLHNTFSYSKFSKIYDSYSKFSRERLAGKFKRKFTHFLPKIHSQKNTPEYTRKCKWDFHQIFIFFPFWKIFNEFLLLSFSKRIYFWNFENSFACGVCSSSWSFFRSFEAFSPIISRQNERKNYSKLKIWTTSEWARCSGRQSHRSVRPRVLMVCACGAQWVSECVAVCLDVSFRFSSSWKLLFFIWGKSCQWSLRRFHVKTYWNFELKTRIPPKNKQTKKIYIF